MGEYAGLGEVSGKRVLVRSDLNVPLDGVRITDDGRIRASVPTIRALADAGARVVVTAHLGRPKGEPDPAYSLAPVAARLSELLGQEVAFATDTVGDSGSSIQLLAPLSDASPIAKFLDQRGPGIQQLAYRVHDLDAVSTVLRERGARLLYDEPRRGTAGSRVNFVHPKSAGGVLVELVEPSPTHR